MDAKRLAILDKLGGQLKNYVDDYTLSDGANVAYSIDDGIIDRLGRSSYLQIVRSDDLSTLPQYLQRLIKQFLPEFKKLNPEFKNAECLKEIS